MRSFPYLSGTVQTFLLFSKSLENLFWCERGNIIGEGGFRIEQCKGKLLFVYFYTRTVRVIIEFPPDNLFRNRGHVLNKLSRSVFEDFSEIIVRQLFVQEIEVFSQYSKFIENDSEFFL